MRASPLQAAAILRAYLALPKAHLAQAATPAFSDLRFNPDETRTVAIVGSGLAVADVRKLMVPHARLRESGAPVALSNTRTASPRPLP